MILTIPGIDYLTLVLAGAFMFWTATEPAKPSRMEWGIAVAGIVLFAVGAARAFMGAVGL